MHIPVSGTEFTQPLSIRASRFSGLRACISLRNTIYNSRMPSSSFLHGHWQGEPPHIKNPPCFCLQTMKCTSPRFGQINSRGHIEHSVTPFLVSFITNSMDWILFIYYLVRYLPNFMPLSIHPLLPSPTTYPPLYFYIANEIPPYQIPTRRGRRMGKICSNYPRSAILASNPPIFSTPPPIFL